MVSYGRTRSETRDINAFLKKTKNHCVVFQIYHDTEICPETHDLEELWQRDIFLTKGCLRYNREQFKTETIEWWRTGKGGPHMTPLHITDLQDNYPTIAALIKRGDIIEDCEKSGYGTRSDGVYFYDGANIIFRDCSIDPYGSVPKTFKAVSEFPPDYWDKPKYVVDNWLDECRQQFTWHTGDATFSQLNLNEFEWEFGENPESNSKSELFDGHVNQYYIKFDYNDKKYAVIGFYHIGDKQREYLNKNTISVSNIPKKVWDLCGVMWEDDPVFKDYDYVMQ